MYIYIWEGSHKTFEPNAIQGRIGGGVRVAVKDNAIQCITKFSGEANFNPADLPIRDVMFEHVKYYEPMLNDALKVMEALTDACIAKVSKACSQDIRALDGLYDHARFRVWMHPSTRDAQAIKERLLKNPSHKLIEPLSKKLKQHSSQIALIVGGPGCFLSQGLQPILKSLEEAASNATLYIAYGGIVNQTFVKKNKGSDRYPAEVLRNDCKLCLKGLREMGLWLPPATCPEQEVIVLELKLELLTTMGYSLVEANSLALSNTIFDEI